MRLFCLERQNSHCHICINVWCTGRGTKELGTLAYLISNFLTVIILIVTSQWFPVPFCFKCPFNYKYHPTGQARPEVLTFWDAPFFEDRPTSKPMPLLKLKQSNRKHSMIINFMRTGSWKPLVHCRDSLTFGVMEPKKRLIIRPIYGAAQ